MKHSVFQNNLEGWIDGVISQDGLADKELIQRIKEGFERSLQANIEHHKFMMKSAKENNDQTTANRHKLMVDVYQELLPAKKESVS